MAEKIRKTDEEWRQQLTPEQYEVCRRQATERPFTGAYYQHKEPGTYTCVCCGTPLFRSDAKFDSGTGWPSFWKPADPTTIEEQADHSLFMERTEVRCSTCGAHLGHVFDDGPAPTYQRYCINSLSLRFEPDGSETREA